jgi:hypothetical protein
VSLSFYMDHHIHGAITHGLRGRGIDCLTAEEDGREQLADDLLLQRAADLGRIMFSQDDDLLAIAADWIRSAKPFDGLVFGHQLGVTVGQAISNLALIAEVLSVEEMRGQIIWIPL